MQRPVFGAVLTLVGSLPLAEMRPWAPMLFAIPRDPQVASFESAGRSLLELSSATPAIAALRAWEIRV
jgi:hypothetical protein